MVDTQVPVIACAADTYYLPHCAVMLLSALRQHTSLQIHFLHDEQIDEEQLAKLARLVIKHGGEFVAHLIPQDKVAGLPRLRELPAIMWYRIFLPELLPGHERVLYLDCDTLIVGDLSPMWSLEWKGAALAAVNNVLPQAHKNWPCQFGVDPHAYFNSGVLLLNLQQWREQGYARHLIEFGRQHGSHLKWPDQDALNSIFKGRWQRLPASFNAQNGFWFMPNRHEHFQPRELQEAVRNPVIVHFEGPSLVKPWHVFCKNPYRNVYRKLRAQTPWPLTRLQGEDAALAKWAWLPAWLLYPLLRLQYQFASLLRGRAAL